MKSEYERWKAKTMIPQDGAGADIDKCWEWVGAKYRGGYGHFRRFIDGKWKMYKAHRYAYEHHRNIGVLPSQQIVCHVCDNPSCVNPHHLFVGTHQDNMSDCVEKQRNSYGIRKWHKALTPDEINTIRQLRQEGLTYKAIGAMVGTSASQAHRVATYKTHKDGSGG